MNEWVAYEVICLCYVLNELLKWVKKLKMVNGLVYIHGFCLHVMGKKTQNGWFIMGKTHCHCFIKDDN